jgi:hypothetical protein
VSLVDDRSRRDRPDLLGQHWRQLELAQLQVLEQQSIGEPYVFIDWLDGHVWLRSIRESDGPLRLGRHRDVELPIPDDGRISRQHAILEQALGSVYVTDVSSNGTLLNGTPIQPGARHRLKDRDTLRLGETYIKVRIPDVGRDALTEKASSEPDWARLSQRERHLALTLIELWPPDQRLTNHTGPTNVQIAEAMGISATTVKGYLVGIFDKLETYGVARDRRGLADVASRYEDSLRAVHEDA